MHGDNAAVHDVVVVIWSVICANLPQGFKRYCFDVDENEINDYDNVVSTISLSNQEQLEP